MTGAMLVDDWRTVAARIATLAMAVVAVLLLARVEAWRRRGRARARTIAELNDIWTEYATLAMRAAVERGATVDQAIMIGTAVADEMLASLVAERATIGPGGDVEIHPREPPRPPTAIS